MHVNSESLQGCELYASMVRKLCRRIARESDEVAIVNESGCHTYGDLGERCGGILDRIHGAPEGPAVIYGHKELDAVAAMLACTCARRPFIFVDVANPAARCAQICTLADAQLVLCARPIAISVEATCIDTTSLASKPFTMPWVSPRPVDLFYIGFTSGTTGFPKGVKVGCDNFGHFYGWYADLILKSSGVGSHINHASFSFDMGMLDLWPSLARGKRVLLLDHRHNALPRRNVQFLTQSLPDSPCSFCSTPSFLEIMCTAAHFRGSHLSQLKTILVAGEPVSRSLISTLHKRFPKAAIWHGYGPTEVTCLTHCVRVTRENLESPGPLPLGPIVAPTEMRFLDGNGNALPWGQYGELELSGPQVAHGYLPKDHPNNSAFDTRDGRAVYRTGDYGVVDSKAGLLLSGRLDSQLKWHGNRIEIGEVEHVCQTPPYVCQAALVPTRCEDRVVALTLFVHLDPDTPACRSAFAAHLTGSLPTYMRPSALCFTGQLPMTVNGKLDRARLLTQLEESIVSRAHATRGDVTTTVPQ